MLILLPLVLPIESLFFREFALVIQLAFALAEESGGSLFQGIHRYDRSIRGLR